MGEINIYRIIGKITKPNFENRFTRDVRALNQEQAIENMYQTIGSKHRVKRYHIKILNVEMVHEDNSDGV